MAILIFLLGCDTSDCEALWVREKDECRYQAVKGAKDEAAIVATLKAIPDDMARDLVIIRIVHDRPEDLTKLCSFATTPIAKSQCKNAIGRPHISGKQQP